MGNNSKAAPVAANNGSVSPEEKPAAAEPVVEKAESVTSKASVPAEAAVVEVTKAEEAAPAIEENTAVDAAPEEKPAETTSLVSEKAAEELKPAESTQLPETARDE